MLRKKDIGVLLLFAILVLILIFFSGFGTGVVNENPKVSTSIKVVFSEGCGLRSDTYYTNEYSETDSSIHLGPNISHESELGGPFWVPYSYIDIVQIGKTCSYSVYPEDKIFYLTTEEYELYTGQ